MLGFIKETLYTPLDRAITRWMADNSLTILRVGLGIVFFWFGALKLFPGLSPAESLVRSTLFWIDPNWFVPLLAIWEMAIGAGLILGRWMRLTPRTWRYGSVC